MDVEIKEYLNQKGVESKLASVLCSLSEAVKEISVAVRKSDGSKAGSENIYGEEQLALDVQADKIMGAAMKANECVGVVASEELDDEEKVGDGEYAVCYDPLDGSSLVDVNLAVGTIVGIYQAESFIGVKGDEQKAAFIAVYGPSTTVFFTIGDGVVQFRLNEEGHFVLLKESFEVGEKKMFAPGNLRACVDRKDYLELVNYWINEQYTLRYSGGMVPDINQILLKGGGIFTYPGYSQAPDGKLRLLYECAPMAFLMEQAGGAASDGEKRIMEKVVEDLGQKTPILIGSKGEVARSVKHLS